MLRNILDISMSHAQNEQTHFRLQKIGLRGHGKVKVAYVFKDEKKKNDVYNFISREISITKYLAQPHIVTFKRSDYGGMEK
jgi:hypothetical protein